jgi:hypothetical protein
MNECQCIISKRDNKRFQEQMEFDLEMPLYYYFEIKYKVELILNSVRFSIKVHLFSG